MTVHYHSRVSTFGDLRVNGYLLLTAAYRSLSRPSSAPSAKASALCPCLLDLSLVFFAHCTDKCLAMPEPALVQVFVTLLKNFSESAFSGFSV